MRNRYLLGCLLLSGFAGLAYELLWVRLLSFVFGSTTLSFSTVLAVFFGGLALGAWLSGRRAHKIKRPIRAYALIEIGTGVAGLLLYPILRNLGGLFAAVDPGTGLTGALVRVAFAAPILVVPTVLMGATLPIITLAMIEKDEEVGRGTAFIYGFNTLGAFLGTYLVTYHLLPSMGVFATNIVIVVVNLVVGGIALVGAKRWDGRAAEAESAEAQAQVSEAQAATLKKIFQTGLVLTFVGGFAAICFQVVWARLFSIFLEGTIYGVGSVLIAVLVGIALGSLFITSIAKNSRNLSLWFAGLQLATVLSVSLITKLLPWIKYILINLPASGTRGQWIVHQQLIAVFVILFVPSFCSGASFPLLIRIVERRAANTGRSLGSLYTANTVGAILGSLVTGFFLISQAGSVATFFVGIILTAFVGAIGAAIFAEAHNATRRLVAVLAVLGAVALHDGFDARLLSTRGSAGDYANVRKTHARTQKEISYFSEGRSANVLVTVSASGRGLSLNGLGQGTLGPAPPFYVLESALVAFIPLAHRAHPKNALVVGLGAGVTVHNLLGVGLEKVTVVELEERVPLAVERIFEGHSNLLAHPNLDLRIDDARHQLLIGARRGDKYDVITSMPAHPWVASSIFTKEFFELARSNLSPGGVFCTWFGTGKMDRAAVESLMRAFVSAFPHYVVYNVPEAGAYYVVGSQQALRLGEPHVDALLAHPIFREQRKLSAHFLAERVHAVGDATTPALPVGIVNTDDTAFVEVHAPVSSTTSPILRDFFPVAGLQPSFVAAANKTDFLLAVGELHLRTKDGRITKQRKRPRQQQLMQLISRPGLDPSLAAYLRGRLALATDRRDAGRQDLEGLIDAPGPIGTRARKFLALSDPNPVAALAALDPQTSDVLSARLDVDEAGALATAAQLEAPANDPLLWFVVRAARESPMSPDERQSFKTRVLPKIRDSGFRALARLCQKVARAENMTATEFLCAKHERRLIGARAEQLLKMGRQAGVRGNFPAAAALLLQAHAGVPFEKEKQLNWLLVSLVETNRIAEITSLQNHMRALGFSEAFIAHTEAAARAGRLQLATDDEPPKPRPAGNPATAGTPREPD